MISAGMRRSRRGGFVRVLGLASLVASCAQEGDGRAPCSAEGQCLPGFACREGFCIEVPAPNPDAEVPKGIGPEGGRVCHPDDNVCVTIPAGALSGRVEIGVIRASATVFAQGLTFLTRAYRVVPETTELMLDATIEMPFETPADQPGPFDVYRARVAAGPWDRITGERPAHALTAPTRVFGIFVVAQPTPAPDAGFEVDSGAMDGGVEDAAPDAFFPDAVGMDAGFRDARPPRDARVPDTGEEIELPDIKRASLPDVSVIIVPDGGTLLPDIGISGGTLPDTGTIGGGSLPDTSIIGGPMDTGTIGGGTLPDTGTMVGTQDTGTIGGGMMDTGTIGGNEGDSGTVTGPEDSGPGLIMDVSNGMDVFVLDPMDGGLLGDTGTANDPPDAGN